MGSVRAFDVWNLKQCNSSCSAGPVNAGPKLAKELPHRRKRGKVRCHFGASASRISTQDYLITLTATTTEAVVNPRRAPWVPSRSKIA